MDSDFLLDGDCHILSLQPKSKASHPHLTDKLAMLIHTQDSLMSMMLFKYLSGIMLHGSMQEACTEWYGGISEYKGICQRELFEIFQFKIAKSVYQQFQNSNQKWTTELKIWAIARA